MAGFARRAGALGLVTMAALGPSPPAVQAPQEQRPIFRGGANVVRVDVTVTNLDGGTVIVPGAFRHTPPVDASRPPRPAARASVPVCARAVGHRQPHRQLRPTLTPI